MPTLKDLEIDRVDAVEEPATGHKFLILKTEDPNELRANLSILVSACEGVFKVIKDSGIAFPGSVADSLSRLASILQYPAEFKANKESAGEPQMESKESPTAEKKADEGKVESATTKATDIDLNAITVAVQKGIEAAFEKLLKEQEEKKTEPVSKQAKTTEPEKQKPRKLGEGLFTNIIFGTRS